MTQPWFRFWRSTVHKAKVQKLADPLFKVWVNLLCCTDDAGALGDLDDVAFELRLSRGVLDRHVAALIKAELLDRDDGGLIRAHDWDEHQKKSDVSTARVKRHRERMKGQGGTADETPGGAVSSGVKERLPERGETVSRNAPETETEQKTEQTQDAGVGAGAGSVEGLDLDWRRFWAAFPRRDDASEVLGRLAWTSLADMPPIDDMLGAVAGYRAFIARETAARKPGAQPPPLMHAANWLRERRFEAFLEAGKASRLAADAEHAKRMAKIPEGPWRAVALAFGAAHGWPLWDGGTLSAALLVGDSGALVMEFERRFALDFAVEKGITAKIAAAAGSAQIELRTRPKAVSGVDPLEIPEFLRRKPEPKADAA